MRCCPSGYDARTRTGLGSRDVASDTNRANRYDHTPGDSGPARLARAFTVGLIGAAAYLVTLMVAAVIDGRSPLYALRAIYAIFNGDSYLPEYRSGFPRTYGPFEVLKSLMWVAGLGVLAAVVPALLTPRRVRRSSRLAPWLAIGIAWSMVLFVVGFLVLGFPARPNVQRAATSYEGVRALGLVAFALAHVVYGAVVGLLLRNATRPKVIVLPE